MARLKNFLNQQSGRTKHTLHLRLRLTRVVWVYLLSVLLFIVANFSAHAEGDDTGDLTNCSVTAVSCGENLTAYTTGKRCETSSGRGTEWVCLSRDELQARFSNAQSGFDAFLKRLDTYVKTPVGSLTPKDLLKFKMKLRFAKSNLKYISSVQLKRFDLVPELKAQRHKDIQLIKDREKQVAELEKQVGGRELVYKVTGKITEFTEATVTHAKSAYHHAVEAVDQGMKYLDRTVGQPLRCAEELAQQKERLLEKAVTQIFSRIEEGSINPLEVANLIVYNHDLSSKSKEKLLNQMKEKFPNFLSDVMSNINGYEVAVLLYGSIAEGPRSVQAASRNLEKETLLIANFLQTNLDGLKRDGDDDTKLYKDTLALQQRIRTFAQNQLQPATGEPGVLYSRYKQVEGLWKDYRAIDHKRNEAHFNQIKRLETTVEVLTFVKDASKLTLTVGAGILSGGLVAGAVGGGMDALDTISQGAILDGEVDWAKVGRHAVVGAATGALGGGSGKMVAAVGEAAAKKVLASGASEAVVALVGRGTAVVVGHEVDSVAGAGGAMAEVAWEAHGNGKEVTMEELSDVGIEAYKQNHSARAILTGVGAGALRAQLVKLPTGPMSQTGTVETKSPRVKPVAATKKGKTDEVEVPEVKSPVAVRPQKPVVEPETPRAQRVFPPPKAPPVHTEENLLKMGYRKNGEIFLSTDQHPKESQGFKLHVSATRDNAIEVADTVLPILRKYNVPHKVVENPDSYETHMVHEQRGKYVTIYPDTPEQAAQIAAELNQALTQKKLTGYPIQGEKSLGDSGMVYVRYGKLKNDQNGLQLVRPDGRVVADIRGDQWKPDWVEDPFQKLAQKSNVRQATPVVARPAPQVPPNMQPAAQVSRPAASRRVAEVEPSVVQISAKAQKDLMTESSHPGVDKKANVAALEAHGLLPHEQIQVQGAKYSLGQPFDMGDGRIGVVAVVDVNGQKSTQLFYRSNSQGTFRLMPARNKGGFAGLPGFDKGAGEYTLELPSALQKHLQQKIATSKIVEGVSEKVYAGVVRNNHDIKGYFEYAEDPNGVHKAITTEKILEPPIGKKLRAGGHEMLQPEQVKIARPESRPDFKAGPVNEFKMRTATAGEVDAMVFRSRDGKIEYTVCKDSLGKIWFANATAADSPILAGAGVARQAIDGGELMTPLWEYHEQIPRGYAGQINPNSSHYAESWNYLKQIPEIQEYYRVRGEVIPQ